MTDGEQTVLDPNSSANEILEVASKPLKDKGIHIIALGIGRRANKSNLGVIASEGGVYSAVNFRELRSVISQLKKGTCPGKISKPKQCLVGKMRLQQLEKVTSIECLLHYFVG